MPSAVSAERRAARRHRVSFQMVFDDGGSYGMGTVLDVSATGLLLEVDRAPRRGARVRLVPIGDAGDILFDVRAEVVRRERTEPERRMRIGLRFLNMNPSRMRELRRLVREMPPTEMV